MIIEDTIKAEYQSINDGSHFWCETHLAAIPITKQSADSRYCQDCYHFLYEEVLLLAEYGQRKRPWWVPKPLPERIRTRVQAILVASD